MFLSTLSISDSWIKTNTRKLDKGGDVSPDQWGKHAKRGNAISPDVIQSVIDHINSMPRTESHYLRKNTTREFLEEHLTVPAMHTLYLSWLPAHYPDLKNPASERQYLDIFNTRFNISFFKPKKDRCNTCNNMANVESLEDKESALYQKIKEKYDKHNIVKEKARDLKNGAKEEFQKNSKTSCKDLNVMCIDYQKNLTLPNSETNAFYYQRKVGVYNFTVYDIGRSLATCYCYDENIANKGANEVASFLLHYFTE